MLIIKMIIAVIGSLCQVKAALKISRTKLGRIMQGIGDSVLEWIRQDLEWFAFGEYDTIKMLKKAADMSCRFVKFELSFYRKIKK